MKHLKVILVALAICSFAFGLAACGSYNNARGKGDAPVGQKLSNPRDVINFPDGFENVAMACDGHGHRVYSTTRDASPVVIADPSCK